MAPATSKGLLPVACRYVPLDLWFTTHLDTRWNCKQIKHWILSKCLPESNADPPRAVSPITFALPSEESLPFGSEGAWLDLVEDDEVLSFGTTRHSKSTRSPSTHSFDDAASPTSSTSETPLHLKYTVLAYSTGQILEDQAHLEWYHLRPHELLEVHEAGAIASLPRRNILNYSEPYFEARVKTVSVFWSGPSEETKRAYQRNALPDGVPVPRRHKSRSEWADRWVVVRGGNLILCRDRMELSQAYHFPVASLNSLQQRADDPLVIRASFGPSPKAHDPEADSSVPSSPGPGTTPPLLPLTELQGRRGNTTPRQIPTPHNSLGRSKNKLRPVPGSSASTTTRTDDEDVEPSTRSAATDSDRPGGIGVSEGARVELTMLDKTAHECLLRTLHRLCRDPDPLVCHSDFLPSQNPFHHSEGLWSPSSSPPEPSHSQRPFKLRVHIDEPYMRHTVRFPEWRQEIATRARWAGMGVPAARERVPPSSSSKRISWPEVLSAQSPGSDDPYSATVRGGSSATRANWSEDEAEAEGESEEPPASPLSALTWGGESASGSEDGSTRSEVEWEGWMDDLERQSAIKKGKMRALSSSPPSAPPSPLRTRTVGSLSSSPTSGQEDLAYSGPFARQMEIDHDHDPERTTTATSAAAAVAGNHLLRHPGPSIIRSTVTAGNANRKRGGASKADKKPSSSKGKDPAYGVSKSKKTATRDEPPASAAAAPRLRKPTLLRRNKSSHSISAKSNVSSASEVPVLSEQRDGQSGDGAGAEGSGKLGIGRRLSVRSRTQKPRQAAGG
ncbi:hypothetical protein PUNSTDRAFT_124144 [Punctularia strigosozonata HHB-11173 SS5]|uniref:uncharacterized protein n=1 Tax=Punctularia strigosozonata (strain HHB-11173) TaxID=741275 RepID=UPI0004417336|nr:uncharacterized protein PUNSTDRAFT_124144 [Punctularia strigosozonata HHB-11173 SS5]EIN14720.1 hypothetical protein PUNSTDRAFT_124144 [Punctularia strigosozonata HHB-11173 SS5]